MSARSFAPAYGGGRRPAPGLAKAARERSAISVKECARGGIDSTRYSGSGAARPIGGRGSGRLCRARPPSPSDKQRSLRRSRCVVGARNAPTPAALPRSLALRPLRARRGEGHARGRGINFFPSPGPPPSPPLRRSRRLPPSAAQRLKPARLQAGSQLTPRSRAAPSDREVRRGVRLWDSFNACGRRRDHTRPVKSPPLGAGSPA